jgi:hypothetical protein
MADEPSGWLFLSNHGTVLLSVAADPTMEVGQIARLVGASELTVRRILGDLLADGYLVLTGDGPPDRYEINRKAHLRHPLFRGVELGPLIDALREHRTV